MTDRTAGALFGLAIGDALGAEIEFLTLDTIRYRHPPNGPLEPPGDPARVTDDTQLALAVAEALIAAPKPLAPSSLADALCTAFKAWFNAPENNRAPDSACLNSCEALENDTPWPEAGDISSMSSGANMRVAPVGLLGLDAMTQSAVAQLQAAITHCHPVALTAADLTAHIVATLHNGINPRDLLREARAYIQSQRTTYHADWLGDIWKRVYMMRSAEEYIAYGWDACQTMLDKVEQATVIPNYEADPADVIGAGWQADEALGTGLWCFLLYAHDPVAAVRRAAFTSGDSDTLAAIAGAFAGAHHGVSAWPADWVARLEYKDRIDAVITGLAN